MKRIALSLLVAVLLSSCGVKPTYVDPPPGVKKDSYPRVYPDPKTDPPPKVQ